MPPELGYPKIAAPDPPVWKLLVRIGPKESPHVEVIHPTLTVHEMQRSALAQGEREELITIDRAKLGLAIEQTPQICERKMRKTLKIVRVDLLERSLFGTGIAHLGDRSRWREGKNRIVREARGVECTQGFTGSFVVLRDFVNQFLP